MSRHFLFGWCRQTDLGSKEPNKIAAGNRHRAFSFDQTMKFEYHSCSQTQSPVAVPELWR